MSEAKQLAAELEIYDPINSLMMPDYHGGYEIDFNAVAEAVLALGYRKATS